MVYPITVIPHSLSEDQGYIKIMRPVQRSPSMVCFRGITILINPMLKAIKEENLEVPGYMVDRFSKPKKDVFSIPCMQGIQNSWAFTIVLPMGITVI